MVFSMEASQGVEDKGFASLHSSRLASTTATRAASKAMVGVAPGLRPPGPIHGAAHHLASSSPVVAQPGTSPQRFASLGEGGKDDFAEFFQSYDDGSMALPTKPAGDLSQESLFNVNERSSFGILSADVLDGTSNLTSSGSFMFPNISAIKLGGFKTTEKTDGTIFKVPELPTKSKETAVTVSSIPLSFMAPPVDNSSFLTRKDCLLDTFMSTNTSMANQSSFVWDKVLKIEDESCFIKDTEGSVMVDLERPVSDAEFKLLNKSDSSFLQGQFSARSTSLGGSNESSQRTRDERFSDFTNAEAIFAQNFCSASASREIKTPFEEGQIGLSEFSGTQDIGDFSKESFQSDGGKMIIDAAERDFNDENKFVSHEEPANATMEGLGYSHSCTSFKAPEGPEEVLSRTWYFMQNTSRLGFLEASTLMEEQRPNLGIGQIRSPDRKSSDKNVASTTYSEKDHSSATSVFRNETYTVNSNGIAAESFLPPNLLTKVSSFADLDENSLAQLIVEASPDHDPVYYASIISKLRAAVEPATDTAAISQFLSSFLEETIDAENIQKHEKNYRSPDKAKNIFSSTFKSRIPIPSSQIAGNQRGRSPEDKSTAKTSNYVTGNAIRALKPVSYEGKIAKTSNKSPSSKEASAKRTVKGQRFSSPIKEAPATTLDINRTKGLSKNLFEQTKENVVPTISVPTSSVNKWNVRDPLSIKQANNNVPIITVTESASATTTKLFDGTDFPLQSDKAVVNWLAVEVGCSEEQTITLRNSADFSLDVNLIIRESTDFQLGLGYAQKVTIGAKSTKDIAVLFTPSSSKLSRGFLVLKPQGMSGPGGRASKATLLLQGSSGCPLLRFKGFSDILLNGRRSKNFGTVEAHALLSWSIEIANSGTAPAFFKLQGFQDADCRHTDDAFISIQPKYGVVAALEKRSISVQVSMEKANKKHSAGSLLGCIALFFGPEVCRQVMNKARLLPGAPRWSSSPALLCVDFTHSFCEVEDELFGGKVVQHDIIHFYDKTRKEVIELNGRVEVNNQFEPLAAEDTLSESRINCTIGGSDMASRKDRRSVAPEVQHFSQAKPSTKTLSPTLPKVKSSSSAVYLDSNLATFPLTKINEKTLFKAKFKNRTQEAHTFRVGTLTKPFVSKHDCITVQPGSYSCLPIFYQPDCEGPHETMLCFYGSNDVVLKLILKGSTSARNVN